VNTPANCTTNWSLFPPRTREVQFDEKWAFVAKKEKHCDPADPADARKGDTWDHVAFDPEHRLVVCVVPGARSEENVTAVVQDFQRRTGGRLMNLMTTDGYLGRLRRDSHAAAEWQAGASQGSVPGGSARVDLRRGGEGP
jgi:hypothetical protein